jgi:quinol monooxygenase YgiN
MNAQWINATNLKLHKKEGNGNTYLLKEAFKDQAHLIGFMQQVYENRFCII